MFPSIITPSTGIVSPGSILSVSLSFISSTSTISSFSFTILLPFCGVRLIRFFNPFLALSTVQSSRSAPKAIIHATSPAAKSSPIDREAIIAIVINSAEDTHFSKIKRVIAKYKRGNPLTITVIQAGFR